EGPAIDDRVGADDGNGRGGEVRVVKGRHDASLAHDVSGRGYARAGRREAQDVFAILRAHEVRETGVAFGDGLDRRNASADRFLEVCAYLIGHSRCAVSPSAPTIWRSPSTRRVLMLV